MNRLRGCVLVALIAVTSGTASAQTVVRPGFNLFSAAQDAEIGKQSALRVDQQLPMVNYAAVSRYVSAIGARLAARAPGPQFAYRFKVVNASDVNAFALPGGYVYVNRGLISSARTEGELAGVIAHEIAHVALRHPTTQATKAYAAQAGLGLLGALLGERTQTSTGQMIGAVGGFGMNTLFLKYSRSAESQADVIGSQIMTKAGYDPIEMANFFGWMSRQAGGNASSFATFLSDHPAPANREARVRQEARLMGTPRVLAATGDLRVIQTELNRLPAAPSMAALAARKE